MGASHFIGETDLLKSDESDNRATRTRYKRGALESALAQVETWDFALTKRKLSEPDYCGWSTERVNVAERDYKRFLALTKAVGQFPIVPSKDLDRFWHEHILDTRRYERDCFALFGAFMHHNPFYGMNGLEEEIEWKSAAFESNLIWQDAFGVDLYQSVDADSSQTVRHCRSHCIPSAATIAACNRPHCRGHCIP